jgi:very-short-patch-repair endonuclease
MASGVSTARRLRRDQTDAERKLWVRLRDRRLGGLKFRRQVNIETYVVDFLCADANLVVEIDGGQHAIATQADADRTKALEAHGYLVLRFWNNDVLQNTDGVVEAIIETLTPLPPHPDPLPDGEREQA